MGVKHFRSGESLVRCSGGRFGNGGGRRRLCPLTPQNTQGPGQRQHDAHDDERPAQAGDERVGHLRVDGVQAGFNTPATHDHHDYRRCHRHAGNVGRIPDQLGQRGYHAVAGTLHGVQDGTIVRGIEQARAGSLKNHHQDDPSHRSIGVQQSRHDEPGCGRQRHTAYGEGPPAELV